MWSAQWSVERNAYCFVHDVGQHAWSLEDVEVFDAAYARQCVLDLQAAVLGEGSFGVVRRAEHLTSRAPCAVKSLSATPNGEEDEAQSLTIFGMHPHDVTLLDSFSACGRVHLVMELCAGGGLDTLAAGITGSFRHLGGTEDVSREGAD